MTPASNQTARVCEALASFVEQTIEGALDDDQRRQLRSHVERSLRLADDLRRLPLDQQDRPLLGPPPADA